MILRLLLVFALPFTLVAAAIVRAPQNPEPPEHYLVKVNMQGELLGAWEGPWSCVCDKRSGLLWEVKTDNEDIHDGRWTYSWFIDSEGVANNGDCYFELDRCDTEDLIRHTNRERLCQAGNWRLPTLSEINTIISKDNKPGSPTIESEYFPKTMRGDYWTSENKQKLSGIYRYLTVGGTAVNFIGGDRVTIPYRNAAFVRLVTSRSTACHKAPQ
ncbi:hypothetical protein Misp06_01546 [Microbulbifer sp. NBRC 101763]|uniref:Lcl C-terminal domain-containing protein n=1 Tax=unclassified Microbulbifer TaxID=2619833 RepID=UPI0024AD75A8|nr:DUF1566 domain-containing protein [Microbulbifer sp. MLAF003]WHI51899.1 DUF1566 domain-containing protein [Microbulbifer sp. MLAF003]